MARSLNLSNRITTRQIIKQNLDLFPNNSKSKAEKLTKTSTILNFFHDILADEMIESGYRFEVPSKLGIIKVSKLKNNLRCPDFHSTKKIYGEINKTLPKGQKKIIYFNNRHSGGWRTRWEWKKRPGVKVKNIPFYRFKANRFKNRALALHIKNGGSVMNYDTIISKKLK